jgi:hypothetical protein
MSRVLHNRLIRGGKATWRKLCVGCTAAPESRRRRPLRLDIEPAAAGTKAFFSHKTVDKVAAKGVADALKLMLPKDQIFVSLA